jgi:tellurite resistance protein
MERDVLGEIIQLLSDDGEETVNTSMRVPARLRRAAALAVTELGAAPSTTHLTVTALRHAVETAVMSAALEEHYQAHPSARPDVAEVACALAEQDGSELAEHPELIQRAAQEIERMRSHPDPDDVLLWAEGLLSGIRTAS